jgi:hypothetical protein
MPRDGPHEQARYLFSLISYDSLEGKKEFFNLDEFRENEFSKHYHHPEPIQFFLDQHYDSSENLAER